MVCGSRARPRRCARASAAARARPAPRPAIGASASCSGRSTEHALDLLVDVAVSSASDSALGSSGANAGSSGRSRARVCMSPVTSPSARSARATRPGRRRARRARAPSRRARRPGTPAGCRASRRSGGPANSYQPASGAMFGNSRADRKRSSSSSGLTPGSTRRNALRISSSPNTTEELDCSTPTGRDLDAAADARGRGLGPAEAQHAVLDRDVVALADPVQQLAPLRGVGERVVDRPAVGLARSRARSSPPSAGRSPSGSW